MPVIGQVGQRRKPYIGLETCARRTTADDDVSRLLRLALEVVLQDLLRAGRIARLRIQSGARVVRGHTVSAAKRVLHVAPGMVLGRGLDVPDVACVAVELPGLDRGGDVLGVADRAAGGVDEPGAFLEVFEEVGVDEVAGAFV